MKLPEELTWVDLTPGGRSHFERFFQRQTEDWRCSGQAWWNDHAHRANLKKLDAKAHNMSSAAQELLLEDASYQMRAWCRSFIQLKLDATKRGKTLHRAIIDYLLRNYTVSVSREAAFVEISTLQGAVRRGLCGPKDYALLSAMHAAESLYSLAHEDTPL